MSAEASLVAHILGAWASIATAQASDEAIMRHTDRLENVAEGLLTGLGGPEERVIASASALAEGMRTEAQRVRNQVLAEQQAENLSDQAVRARIHERLGVPNAAAVTTNHLIMVSKVNDRLASATARRALVNRLTVARAQSLARMTIRLGRD